MFKNLAFWLDFPQLQTGQEQNKLMTTQQISISSTQTSKWAKIYGKEINKNQKQNKLVKKHNLHNQIAQTINQCSLYCTHSNIINKCSNTLLLTEGIKVCQHNQISVEQTESRKQFLTFNTKKCLFFHFYPPNNCTFAMHCMWCILWSDAKKE